MAGPRHGSLMLAILAVASVCSAQQPEVPTGNGAVWGSAYLLGGTPVHGRLDLFLSDLRALAPGSELWQQDLASYRKNAGTEFPLGDEAEAAFACLVGLHPFARGERTGPELRLGAYYALENPSTFELHRKTGFPYDTLTSSQTGGQYIVDSTAWDSYRAAYRMERVGIEASLVFRLGNGHSRWNLFGGVGVGGGAVVNAHTTVEHRSGWSIGAPDDRWEMQRNEEDFRNGGGYWASGFLPMGVGFRLARRGDFLRHADLFLEYRPELLVLGGNALGSRTVLGGAWLFGVRVRLRDRKT